ncbi:MAG TPA: tetratricopeptide repeat protein [Myxococcales bacterium]|jgi:tetratricopeptide (TPR) repeat protein
MKRLVLTSLAALLASACATTGPAVQQYNLSSKANERTELVAKLRRDLIKVDRSINVTEKLIAASRSAPYLPDLVFRQAELYVEKSRYRFHLEAELNLEQSKRGSLVVPDVTLLKQKAISLYQRIVDEFPDYKENDKVRFFEAHEYRELGQFDKAIATYQQIVDKHPRSPLVPEALLIIADYWFDKSKLDDAETFYLKILDTPPSPAHDLARYKMGWVWINRGKHAEAVKYFEAAARSPVLEGAGAKALQVKGLALSDLVYSYTESKPAKGALEFFEALCDSSNAFENVLEKLGNRYFIKQEFENAAPAYRRLLVMSRDFERDPERASRLYETIKASKGKVIPRAEDIKAIVRVAARTRVDQRMSQKERGELLEDLEVYSRDLATTLQVQAQKAEDKVEARAAADKGEAPKADKKDKDKKDSKDAKKDEKASAAAEKADKNKYGDDDDKKEESKEERQVKRLYSEASDGYESYLDLFRNEKHRLNMMKNRADSLFNAARFAEAGRQYEEVAKKVEGEGREEPLYSALVAFQNALRTPEKLSYFERVDSRSGIRQLGAFYVKSFPKHEHASKVKFNMARSFYDDGLFKEAGDLFSSFALEYPNDPDAIFAADLALDSFHSMKDFKGMATVGEKLMQSGLPQGKRDEIAKILAAAKTEELSEVVIATDTGTEDAVTRLLKIADDPARANTDVAEKALVNAFVNASAKRDLKMVQEIAQKILQRYPKTQSAASAVMTLASFAYEMADYDQMAALYEGMIDAFPGDPTAISNLDRAASLRLMMGDLSKAAADFEKLAAASKRGDAFAKLAEVKLLQNNFQGAEQAASTALAADPTSAKAAAVLGQALLEQGKAVEAEDKIVAAGRALQGAASADPEALAKVFFLWGEAVFKQFREVNDVEKKAPYVQRLQQAYTSAAQMGSDSAIAGMFRLGQAMNMLADALMTMPDPAGLKENEKAQVRAAIAKQADEVRKGGDDAFDACVKKAKELEVYTPFTLGCRTRKDVNTKLAVPPGVAAVGADRVAKLRAALEKNNSDVAALEGIGKAYLEAGDLRRARLVFTRIIELDENRGPAHGALGFVMSKLGEPGLAHMALKKAIDLDARDEKAHANLAALMCRFGDAEGAKEELSRVKGALAGPDVDAEYQACRK